MNLYNNHFSGFIPLEIRYLKNLNYLKFSRNQLTGCARLELGELSSLDNVDLACNALGDLQKELIYKKWYNSPTTVTII